MGKQLKVGDTVTLHGWINVRRDHGKIIFMDLRSSFGLLQCVFTPNEKDAYDIANAIRPEWVVEITGIIKERPENMKNHELEFGGIELEAKRIKIINEALPPPFNIDAAGHDISEDLRLMYRYLDLRRPRLHENILKRDRVLTFMRNYLHDSGFIEIETPILSKSTPEGARDYVVPYRKDPGRFYALPQSPQQYKQLLMVAGFEKYFQIARCMRDEDTRLDRQPEFTQVDMEMSFISRDDIMQTVEKMLTAFIKDLYPQKRIIESPWPHIQYASAMEKYKTDRPDLRKDASDQHELAFAWIVDFPLFESEKENGYYAPSHHMFTMPKEEDVPALDTNPHSVKSYQFDLVLNGNEVGGGGIRIHNRELQEKIFQLIGFTEEQKTSFGHMLTAFQYGAPPHGGIALGFDRLFMVLQNEPNIREIMAFPKTGEGEDPMMNAPAQISKAQLEELGIIVKKERK